MSEIFKVNEYHKGDYKFTEEGNLKDSKKEGLWETYIHFEIKTHIIGVDYDPENPKIINSGKYGKSLFKEETFLNGELHGLYKTYQWNVEGNWVIDEGFYENGRKTGEWISHGKWNDRFVCNYKNGKKHGSFKGYQQGWVTPKEHSTDIITSEGTYKDGELHGNYKSYHFEKYKSLLYKDLNYKNGKLHGYCKTYRLYPDPGKIEDEGMYKNGEKTGKFM